MAARPWHVGVSYFGNRDPRHVDRDLAEMAQAGLTFVVHTFSENDLAFYADTMAEIVARSHHHGLEVFLDPWGVGRIFGGEAFSDFALRHRNANQVSAEGDPLPAACPTHPETREFLHHWVEAAARTGADGVFFDEPHFYHHADQHGCWCEACQRAWREEQGRPLPQTFTPEMRRFQMDRLVALIQELARHAKDLGLRTALCLLPHQEEEDSWPRFFSLPELDIVGTDPYWHNPWQQLTGEAVGRHVKAYARKVAALAQAHGKEPQIWIQAFRIPAGTEEDVARAVHAAAKAGVRNLAAWSFRGTAFMSSIRSEQPEVVWRTLIRAYQEVRQT